MFAYAIVTAVLVIGVVAFMNKLEDIGSKWREEAEEEKRK